MQQLTGQQRLKPWMGFVLFAVLMAIVRFVCFPMQTAWGISGFIATELFFLVIASSYAFIFRIPVKEMFPVKKFSAKDLFGSLFLCSGGVMFGLISIYLVGLIFPKSLEGRDVQALNDYIGGSNGYILTVLVLSVLPAVCEEAVHRGAILSNFRTIKKDWVIVILMAVFFCAFHLSVLRFINTAILGACLTYIVVKKNNLLLSSLAHFIINFVSVSISYFSSAQVTGGNSQTVRMSGEVIKAGLGLYLMIGMAAPFLIVTGLMLLDPQSNKKIRFLFAGIVSAVMLACSVFITVSVSSGSKDIVKTNMSYTVDYENSESLPLCFTIENEGDYTLAVVVMNSSGNYSVRMEKSNGDVVLNGMLFSGGIKTYSQRIALEPGDYRLIFVNGNGTAGGKPVISVQIISD